MENSPRCLHCADLITVEIGYSEYTITGEQFKCRNNCFSAWEYDDDSKSLKAIADACKHFEEGSPEFHSIDCHIQADNECNCGQGD